MTVRPYSYDRLLATRHTFTSTGKRAIIKVVEFTPTHLNNVFNLAFGDLLADGSIDDLVNSNNGDILKVLTTVIQIIKDFTEGTPECIIMFLGSTKEQTALYHRIVKTYYLEFSKEFTIKGVYKIKNKITIVTFDPTLPIDYLAFLLNGLIKFVNISVTGKNKARKSAVKKQHSPVFIVTKAM